MSETGDDYRSFVVEGYPGAREVMPKAEAPAKVGVTRPPLLLPIEPYHVLVYGESGTRKSTFAATGRKPQLVFMFDPLGKETPYTIAGYEPRKYHKRGNEVYSSYGLQSYDVLSAKSGVLLRHIEFFNSNTMSGQEYKDFLKRAQELRISGESSQWASVVVDSLTSMSFAFRMAQKFFLNPMPRKEIDWWMGTTDALEEMIFGNLVGLPCDLFLVAHVDSEINDDTGGIIAYKVKAPGRLGRGDLAKNFPEFYHTFVREDEDKQQQYLLQTRPRGRFHAASQLGLPDSFPGDFREILALCGSQGGRHGEDKVQESILASA